MEFRILGRFEVVANGELMPLGGLQQRAVLGLLLVRAPALVSRDQLIDELWGERPPPTAGHAVQVHISGLRKALRGAAGAHELVRSVGSGYALDVDSERIDAQRFEQRVSAARDTAGGDPARAQAMLDEALGLWRGPPLAEFADYEFARREAARLEELRADAAADLVEARMSAGAGAEVIGAARDLVTAEPLRERPRRLLMLALYRAGRQAEALDAYRDAVTTLDELGLQPGPRLRALEEAILRHDPALQPAVPAPEPPTPASAPSPEPASARRPAPQPSRRKVVTALFCDVTGSTALGEELDPEALHGVMNHYWRELRAVIERHGGTVEKLIGDAVVAVFGVPRVREDDALRAVRAAADIRNRLPDVAREVGVSLSFRTAVNTGLVLVGEGENLAIGDAVNVAARLEQAAAPGEILLGEQTLELVRAAVEVEPLSPLVVKGKSRPVQAFRLIGIDPLASGLPRDLARPLVGRERELDLLRGAWNRSVEESGCHLFTLLGVAGVGKSRLVAELLATVGDAATVLQGRCLPYGEGITFWPLADALRAAGAAAEPVVERLNHGGAATPEELFFEVRRLLEGLAREHPVILHVDDLQWAETMLLDLLDHVVELSHGAPILLLCSARPELLEDRTGWGGGKLNATAVLLRPLAASDCRRLLDGLDEALADDVRAHVIEASDGNPLFLEEMAALARDRGVVSVPSTIHALLAARLERLPAEERALLERGAIEGEVFHRAALDALAGGEAATDPERALTSLVRKELIRPAAAQLHRSEAYRFRHLLVRDAAYDGLPKATRAALHERFARWLADDVAELAELDELTGWHLEQTIRYQRELGLKPDQVLADLAAEHLHAAGRRAGQRGDVAAATNLLERSLALALPDGALAAAATVDLAEQLVAVGDLTRVGELLVAAERDPAAADLASCIRFEWMIQAEPEGAVDAIAAGLPAILDRFTATNNTRGLAKAHMVASAVQWYACQATEAGAELRLVADYAGRAGDRGMRARALAIYVKTLVYGRRPASAIAAEITELEREDAGPFLAAFVDLGRAELARLGGSPGTARSLAREAIDGLARLGNGADLGGLWQDLSQIELFGEEPAAALAALERSDAVLTEIGERAFRSTTQALLADAHARLGHRAEAIEAIALSEQLSAPEDAVNDLVRDGVRARLAFADGDLAAAERWARSAVQHASSTDFVRHTAAARLELARVLAATDRVDDAIVEARAAVALSEAKGDLPAVAQAAAFLDQHSGPQG